MLVYPVCCADEWRARVIDGICRPVGYFAVTDETKFQDYFAFCVIRLVQAAEENSGHDVDNILFDQPLVRSSSDS